jgi:predicted Zn-dependent protease with MMP-like domain
MDTLARSNLHRMREIFGPPLRAAAISAFIAGLILLLLNPPSLAGVGGLLALLAGAVAIVLATAWATVLAIGKEMPEPEFRRLVDRSEALASLPPPDHPPSEFDELVMEALDDLPAEFRELLERTPVVVSTRGHEHHAYGHYIGGTVARDIYPDRIVIYQDTLERDFGHDPDLLRAQVERTVRHELAHHLGWGERGVRGLGL